MGCSPWGCKESDTTERLHFHFSFSCIGAGNGNPLQCSCLENPRDGGAWWAAVYGVTQSRTRLKRLSSSRAPSLCGPRFSPVGLGKRTKQRVRVSKLSWERERVRSLQPAVWGDRQFTLKSQASASMISERDNHEEWLSSLPRNWIRVAWVKSQES